MLDDLITETRNEYTMELDQMPILDILKMMNQEDKGMITAVEQELHNIEKAVEMVIDSFKNQGRLIYIGAGTSGRLGVLDAVECVPTFGSSPEMVQGIIAGGMKAITNAVEGAEDDAALGKTDLQELHLTEKDTVIGIAASGRTPYVVGALQYANSQQANTVSIACNRAAVMSEYGEVAIELDTGAEVLTGSTRLKAGSAQKIVLNMISTTAMVGIGKVYQNLMVDLKSTNYKLEERSKRIIMEATNTDYDTAHDYLEQANHHVKTAIVMILLQCSYGEAVEKIAEGNGFVRNVLEK